MMMPWHRVMWISDTVRDPGKRRKQSQALWLVWICDMVPEPMLHLLTVAVDWSPQEKLSGIMGAITEKPSGGHRKLWAGNLSEVRRIAASM